MRLVLALLLFFMAQHTALAQTVYVTDNLRLGLHQAADTSDRAFRMLESGQELRVIERDRNYAQVRLPDGTQGYVKTAYLIEEKPAKLIVNEVQARYAELEQQLAELQASFAEPAARIAALEQQVEESNELFAQSESQLAQLQAANDSYAQRMEQYKTSLPLTWVGGAAAACLLVGFLAGLWWTDYRSRKRHGGIRIY